MKWFSSALHGVFAANNLGFGVLTNDDTAAN
jgi:hypothetical protein